MSVALIYDPIFLEHDTGTGHPECAERLHSILRYIAPFRDALLWLEPIPASHEQLLLVHPDEHIALVEHASNTQSPIDADTQTSYDSYDAALKAAGAGISAVNAISSGKAFASFAAVRPPGHHATTHRSMGFCLFNNIAITARYAQEMGYEKVLIVDFDVHHGNGTQEIFYDDRSVFYFSSHQYPAYPGSGASDETGSGEGEGFTMNFPLAPGSGDEDILPLYEESLSEVAAIFQPDIILVSAGYDLHRADPLASLNVTTEGIVQIVAAIMECYDVPKLFFLEGGYNIEALGECVAKTIKTMQHCG
ncbi:MAG: histone deacetylase [Campylobacterota bacterium]|nr:histone deacetylase [Campylobacterota bacterium]